MDKAEIRSRLMTLDAQAKAMGLTIDWAMMLQAILMFIAALKPKPPVPPVPGPVVVSAEDVVEAIYAAGEVGKINWEKLFEFLEKILPLILPIFI